MRRKALYCFKGTNCICLDNSTHFMGNMMRNSIFMNYGNKQGDIFESVIMLGEGGGEFLGYQ